MNPRFGTPARLIPAAVLGLALAGCVLVPLPKKANKPRYSSSELEQIRTELTTREAVRQRLGTPDIARDQDRIWVYTWTVGRGQWFAIPVLPMVADNTGPVTSKNYVLFFDFDEAGTVIHREVVTSDDEPYCNSRGECVEHKVEVSTLPSGAFVRGYVNESSAISLQYAAARQPPRLQPSASRCVVVLWPRREDWDASFLSNDENGLAVGFGGADTPTPSYEWLPVGAYSEWQVPMGDRWVLYDVNFSAEHYEKQSRPPAADEEGYFRDSFRCDSGARLYFEIIRQPTPWYMVHGMRLQPKSSAEFDAIAGSLRRLITFHPAEIQNQGDPRSPSPAVPLSAPVPPSLTPTMPPARPPS